MSEQPSLKGLGAALRQALTCPTCGGSIMVAATGWRGRGTGRHGEAVYDATAMERLDPTKHCTCPGGPFGPQGYKGVNHG